MGDEGGRRRLHPDDFHALVMALAPEIAKLQRVPEDGRTPVKGRDYDDGRPGKDCDMEAVREQVSGFLLKLRPKAGDPGREGFDGWSPELAVAEHGERRVLQVVGWFGGGGKEPRAGFYLSQSGPTWLIGEATNIRGDVGKTQPQQLGGASDMGLKQLIRKVMRQETLTTADILALIEEHTMEDFDQVPLDDQTAGAAEVLTFTFGADVHKVWVKLLPANADDTSTARVRVDGGEPDGDTGHQIEAGIPQPISAVTSVVKIYTPAGKTVNVTGYRRRT